MIIKKVTLRAISFFLAFLMLVTMMRCFPLMITSVAETSVSDGIYFIEHVGSGKVLDIPDNSSANGTQLQIWQRYEDHTNQKFKIEQQKGGYYKITSLSSNKVVEVRNSSKDNYTEVSQWADAGLLSQRWYIDNNSDGTFSFRNANSGKYMNVFLNSTENGAKIIQFDNDGTSACKYRLQKLDSSKIISACWERDLNVDDIEWQEYNLLTNTITNIMPYWENNTNINIPWKKSSGGWDWDKQYMPKYGQKILCRIEYIDRDTVRHIVSNAALIPSVKERIDDYLSGQLSDSAIATVIDPIIKVPFLADGFCALRGVCEILASKDASEDWNNFVNLYNQYDCGIIKKTYITFGNNYYDDSTFETIKMRYDSYRWDGKTVNPTDYAYINSSGLWKYDMVNSITYEYHTLVVHVPDNGANYIYTVNNNINNNPSNYVTNNTSYDTGNYTVNVLSTSSLNVRSGPGTNNQVIGSLKSGNKVEVTQISNGCWGKISYNGITGWISLKYANYSGKPVSIIWSKDSAGEYTLTKNSVNFRTSAGTNSSVIGRLNSGDIVQVLETATLSDGRLWAHITYKGTSGYCCMKEGNEYWLTKKIYPSKPSVGVQAGTSFADTTFTWNNCSNAKNYDIRIYNAAGQVIESKFGLTSTSYNSRLKSGSYQADVASVYSSDSYTFSDRVSFTVDKVTPEKPTITVSAGNDLSDTFVSWNSCKYADCYDMIIYKANGTEYKKITNVKDTSFKGNLSDIADYYVVVTAKNNTDNTQAKSDKKTFKVVSAVPSKPTLNVLPGNNYTNTTFSWNKCDNANTYTLDIINKDTGETILSKSLTDTSYEMILSIAGNYYAKVTSVYTKGGTKTSSEQVDFFVESADVTEFELYVKGVSDSSIYLEWTESLHATQYDVYRYENGEYTLLGKTIEREFTDTGLYVGTEYKYYVKSSNQWTSIESNKTTGETILLYLNGSGTEESPYLISSAEDFIEFNSIINNPLTNRMFTKAHFKQTSDIDMGNVDMSPVGSKENSFMGIYNGNYCTITGVSIDRDTPNTGVFGFNDGAIIQNLSVHGTVSSTADNVGGISGTIVNGSKIENCSFYGNIIGSKNVGGIAGNINNGGSMIRCYQIGTVNGIEAVGGITGLAKTNNQTINISYCYHAGGNVNGSGIVGRHESASGQVVYDDCYYLNSNSSSGTNDSTNPGVVSVNDTVLKNLVDTLGEPFTKGNNINSGYPVFVWESELYHFKGQGTSSSPYLISNLDELMTLSNYVNNQYLNTKYGNAYYLQVADIDLGNILFNPIGSKESPFNGKYNGGYYSICGLNSLGSDAGLFGYAQTIEVKNLIVSGSVNGDKTAGGIIGTASQYVELTQCSFNGSCKGTITGGLIGHLNVSGKITDCYHIGTVSGKTAGGLVGEYECSEGAADDSLMIVASYHGSGIVSGKGVIGSTSGNESSVMIENTYYLKNTATSDDYALAVNESVLKDLSVTLEKPYINSDVNNGYPIFDWQASRYIFKGMGTVDSPYLIETAEDIIALQSYINDPSYNTVYGSAYYKQIADIDLGDREWEAIGINEMCPFNGVYEGNYCTIYGLNAYGSTYSGLFGQVGATTDGRNAGVYNLIIKYGTSCSATGVTGGTAAVLMNGASIDQCSVIGDLSGGTGVGGIVGIVRKSGNISNSYHNGNVCGESKAGGIVGYIESGTARIENCYHTSGIVASDGYSGAIVGQSKGIAKLSNCYYLIGTSEGAINGTQNSEAIPVNATVLQNLSVTLGEAFIDNYTVYNNGYPIFAKQFELDSPALFGDINADGGVSVADVVMLQSWLLGRIKDLPDWTAANLYEDDCLDGRDLVLLKSLIIESEV